MAEHSKTNQELTAEISLLNERIRELEGENRQKRTEGDLRTRQMLESILKSAPSGIGVVVNRVIIEVNDYILRLTGYTRDELVGKNSRILYPTTEEFDYVGMEKYLQIAERGSGSVETRWIRKDGEIRHVILSSTPMNPDDLSVGVTFTVLDITSRKRTEEALRRSEEKFRVLFERAVEGIMVVRGKTLEFVNPAIESITGYSLETLTSKPFISFVHPDHQADVVDRHLRRMRGETLDTEHEFRVIAADGAVKWISTNSQVIDWDGAPANLSFVMDITDRKRAEEERLDLERRLSQAQKLESIGTLAGGIAHDFNNLLMGIQGNASLIMMDMDTSHPHYQRLRNVEASVASGADLTKQLLGFSRGGRYDVKPVSLNEIAKKSSGMFGRTRKEISLHEKYASDPCIVEVDRSQMEQVFMNLFVNAWHAMPGGGDLFIETETVFLDEPFAIHDGVKPGRYVKLTISDTGTGMDEQTKERIFDPFFTTKEMGHGSGLGLASVYGIVKGHRGMITVDSKPGQGATFTIFIPSSEKDPIGEKKSEEAVVGSEATILLVDDEKMIMDVSRDMLESLGYRVYTAESGQEALALYREKEGEIDLVILDMILPGMSGSSTFDKLRDINPDVKVLLASGYSIDGQASKIMERNCNGFIQKPFRLEKLSVIVRDLLNK